MKNIAVVGSQWGDEGKGKIVDWLSEQADVVIRFQGGVAEHGAHALKTGALLAIGIGELDGGGGDVVVGHLGYLLLRSGSPGTGARGPVASANAEGPRPRRGSRICACQSVS